MKATTNNELRSCTADGVRDRGDFILFENLSELYSLLINAKRRRRGRSSGQSLRAMVYCG